MGNRPYQNQVIRQVEEFMYEGHRQLTIVCPTGAGKTRIATQLVYKTGNRRVLYVVPSGEIFEQTSEKLESLGIEHTRLEAGSKPDLTYTNNLLAMSQTLARRTSTDMFEHWSPEVIFIDEIHKLIKQHRNITDLWAGVPIIGMTATPVRLDGQNLSDITPALVIGPSIKQLQADGFLVPSLTYQAPSADLKNVKIRKNDYEAKTLEEAYISQGVIDIVPDWWKRKAQGRRTITFAPGVNASKMLTEAYRSHGIRAEHVDGETPKEQRDEALERLRNHQIDVLCNVGLFIEGLDVPEISCVTLVQPTKSISRYMQSVGRGLRLSPQTGKKNLIIIDHTNNVIEHGRVEADRDWPRGGGFLDVEMRICRSCGVYTPADSSICLHCQWEDRAPTERVSKVAQRRLARKQSHNTPIRICPPWAGPVRRFWYDCEKARVRDGYPLPDSKRGIVGFTESRCLKKLNRMRSRNAKRSTRTRR